MEVYRSKDGSIHTICIESRNGNINPIIDHMRGEMFDFVPIIDLEKISCLVCFILSFKNKWKPRFKAEMLWFGKKIVFIQMQALEDSNLDNLFHHLKVELLDLVPKGNFPGGEIFEVDLLTKDTLSFEIHCQPCIQPPYERYCCEGGARQAV